MASVLNLGERLEAIVDLCPQAHRIADIGCDHGFVSAELILEDKAEYVVATEKSKECLNKAILLADAINISDFISFREGDGFDAITKYDKLNCAIIAGMGGAEIIKILEGRPRRLYDFVLQPMKDVPMLRAYLNQSGFKIEVDKLVKENGKFYDVIKTTRGWENLADLEIYFGKTNFTENYEVFYEYLSERQKKLLDMKAQVGELSHKLSTELDNIEQALSLFEQNSDDGSQDDGSENGGDEGSEY